jgi:hypothetical protein
MRTFSIAVLVLVLAAITGCETDPVLSDETAALAGNAPGVRNGPLHRPGEPCLLCHDGSLGDPPAFSVAGTVFTDQTGTTGQDGVTVTMTDSTGVQFSAAPTNTAGNFYVTPDEWTPTFPLVNVSILLTGQPSVSMTSEVGRSGSCATCHVGARGPASAGVVYLTALAALP